MLAKIKPLLPDLIRRRIFERTPIRHINELPVELLIEIFMCCLPIGTFPRPSRDMAPILLGTICRVWRSVSLSTPQLWAQILFEGVWYLRPQNPWNEETFILFGEWLRRSGNCPLSFKIGNHNLNEYHVPVTLKLQAEAHRWKAVSLETDCNCTDDILRMLRIPGRTPMLNDLHILREPEFENHSLIPVTSQLRSFYVAIWFEPFLIDGRFHALSELRIGPCKSCQDYSLIFTQFPLLEILEITAKLPPSPTTVVVYPLQYLHTFIFVGSYRYAQLGFLDVFDTPILESLGIKIFTASSDFNDGTHLSNFLMRCGGRLQRLMLAGNFISCGELVGLTQHMPMLKLLCAEYCLLLGDLTRLCPTLSQIDILMPFSQYYFEEQARMTAVYAVLSRWTASISKERAGTVSSSLIRVPHYKLQALLKDRKVKMCIRQGLCVSRLPPLKECWWKSHVGPFSGSGE